MTTGVILTPRILAKPWWGEPPQIADVIAQQNVVYTKSELNL